MGKVVIPAIQHFILWSCGLRGKSNSGVPENIFNSSH
jgi:hypothetical protein